MNHHGHFFSQTLLKHTQMRSLFMLSNQRVYFFFGKRSENLDVTLCVIIAHVQPELIELVRRSISRVKPYIARLGLAEFCSISLSHQRTSQRKDLSSIRTTDQLGTCRDVPPLVGTAQLQFAVSSFI